MIDTQYGMATLSGAALILSQIPLAGDFAIDAASKFTVVSMLMGGMYWLAKRNKEREEENRRLSESMEKLHEKHLKEIRAQHEYDRETTARLILALEQQNETSRWCRDNTERRKRE